MPEFVARTDTGGGRTDPQGAPSTAEVMTIDWATPTIPFAATPVSETESAAAGGAETTTSRPAPRTAAVPAAAARLVRRAMGIAVTMASSLLSLVARR